MSSSDFPEKVTRLLRSGKQNLMVVAEGGLGKTVGLIEIYRRLLADPTSSDGRKLVPIYVPLAECESDRFAVRRYAVAHYLGLENIEDFSERISNSERLLFDSSYSSYRYVFLLDAVNEHFSGDALVSEIEHISSYQNACVVLSSRTPNRYFSNWKTYRLNRLHSDIVDKVFRQAALDGEMKRAMALPFYLSKYRQLTESGYPMGEVINPTTLMDAFAEWTLQKQIKANSAVRFQLDTYAVCAKYATEVFLPALCFASSCKKQMVFSRYDEEFVKSVVSWLLDDMPIELHSILEKILVPMGYVISSKHGLYRISHQLFRDYFASKLLSSGYEICQYNSSLLARALSEHINSIVLEFFAMSFAGSTGKFLDAVNKMNHILSQDVACRKCGLLQKNLVDMYALCGNTLRDVDLSNRDLRLANFDKFARLLHVNFAGSQFGADTFSLPSFSVMNYMQSVSEAESCLDSLIAHNYIVFEKQNVLVIFSKNFYMILDMATGNLLVRRDFLTASLYLNQNGGKYDDHTFWYTHSGGISLVDVTTYAETHVQHSENIAEIHLVDGIVFYRNHFILKYSAEGNKGMAFSIDTGECTEISIPRDYFFGIVQDVLYVYKSEILLTFPFPSKKLSLYQVMVEPESVYILPVEKDSFYSRTDAEMKTSLLRYAMINARAGLPFGWNSAASKEPINIVNIQYDGEKDILYVLGANHEERFLGTWDPDNSDFRKLDWEVPANTKGFVLCRGLLIVYTDSDVIQYSPEANTVVWLLSGQDDIWNVLCSENYLIILTKKRIVGYGQGAKWIKRIICPQLSFKGVQDGNLMFEITYWGLDEDHLTNKAYFFFGKSGKMRMNRPFFSDFTHLPHEETLAIKMDGQGGAIYKFSKTDFSYQELTRFGRIFRDRIFEPVQLENSWIASVKKQKLTVFGNRIVLYAYQKEWQDSNYGRNFDVVSLLKGPRLEQWTEANEAFSWAEERFYLPNRDFYIDVLFIDDEIVAFTADNISIFTLDGNLRLTMDVSLDFKNASFYRDKQMLYCVPKDKATTDHLYALDISTGKLALVRFQEKHLFWNSTSNAFYSVCSDESNEGDYNQTITYDFWKICEMPESGALSEIVEEMELKKWFSLDVKPGTVMENVLSDKEYLASISAACMERRNFTGKVLDTYYAFTHEVTGSSFKGVEGISDMDREVLKQYGAAEV